MDQLGADDSSGLSTNTDMYNPRVHVSRTNSWGLRCEYTHSLAAYNIHLQKNVSSLPSFHNTLTQWSFSRTDHFDYFLFICYQILLNDVLGIQPYPGRPRPEFVRDATIFMCSARAFIFENDTRLDENAVE